MFLAYLRCSTLKQLKEKSIEIQRELVKRYCDDHDIHEVKFYIDEGISAAHNRPSFNRLMNDVLQEIVEGVLITDLTRFGRKTSELLMAIETITGAGKAFIAINGEVDTTTKEGRLSLAIRAAVAEYEREVIRERLTLGIDISIHSMTWR